MSAPLRVTTEQIVEAYRRTGSVWKAARTLGVVGQSVWERLRAIGPPMANKRWTADELREMRSFVGAMNTPRFASVSISSA